MHAERGPGAIHAAAPDDFLGRCEHCAGGMHRLFVARDTNQRVDDRTYVYGRCARCGLIRLTAPPADISRYYPPHYYRGPSRRRLRWAAWRERYQLRLVLAHAVTGRLVEIGAAWGTFAIQARRAFEVTAVEADADCCDYLRSVVGVPAICSSDPGTALTTLPSSNVVAMWQVIEHLPDPWAALDRVAANLTEGGVLKLSTPNPESLSFRLLGVRWPHVDAPRHHWLIPAPVLTQFLEARGLTRTLLTTSDAGGRRWNSFTWRRAFGNHGSQGAHRLAAELAGRMTALILHPWERRAGMGSCYTAVFTRNAG